MISTGICQIVKFCDDGSQAETPSREARLHASCPWHCGARASELQCFASLPNYYHRNMRVDASKFRIDRESAGSFFLTKEVKDQKHASKHQETQNVWREVGFAARDGCHR
jgi:hypothetical protein